MSQARSAFERFLRWTIEVEWPAHGSILEGEERDAFAQYYRSLPAASDSGGVRRFLRGFWRSEAGWAFRWLAARAAVEGRGPLVLDAGSGFGTYAMLFANAGARVVGADLRPDRLHAAEQRLAFYTRTTGLALPVRYVRADLTRTWEERPDLVWVYNAISHIDPLEGFLGQASTRIRPGGVLVVGDINGAHPAHLSRLAELRSEVHQEYVAPDGTRHTYAVERTFTPDQMRHEMESNGFRVIHQELFLGGMGRLPEALYALLRLAQRPTALAATRARRQLMVASPNGAGSAARA